MTSHHTSRETRHDNGKKNTSDSSASEENTDQGTIRHFERLLKQLTNYMQALSHASLSTKQHHNTCPGDEKMIPVFDPSEEIITVEQWIKSVDKLAIKYDWDDCSIYRLIIPRLQEHAKHWFQWEQHNIFTWIDIKTALLQQFQKKKTFAKLLQEAINYTTEPGQDLGEYCLRKLQKIRKCQLGVPDESIIDLIIDGVRNARIAADLRAASKTTITALFNHMCSLGETPQLVKTFREKGNKNDKRTSCGLLKKYKLYDQQEEQGKIINENLFCYNCGKYGHKSWQCRNFTIKCTRCNLIGHTRAACRI